jgi:Holliday junction DNA helicase RuvA
MIASIAGDVLETRIDSLVIALGGVGMQVMCSPQTISMARVGQKISLSTSLVVREDSLTLFGFESAESRELFEIIQGVSGFGPKLAFTVLASMSAEDLRAAIANEDIARLTKTPGVGNKGAQRLVLELKDRIGYAGAPTAAASASGWQEQVTQALVGLGWTNKDANKAVTTLASQADVDSDDVAGLLRQALQLLGNP